MSKLARIVALSVVSGAVWAAVALVLNWVTDGLLGPVVWGGVALSPFIGLGAGFVSAVFPEEGRVRKALFSLVSLYLAAALFGFGMGAYDLLINPNSGDGWRRNPSTVVLQMVNATVWGGTPFLIVLWPLSYANHSMLSRAWKREKPTRTLGAGGQ